MIRNPRNKKQVFFFCTWWFEEQDEGWKLERGSAWDVKEAKCWQTRKGEVVSNELLHLSTRALQTSRPSIEKEREIFKKYQKKKERASIQ